MMELSKWYLCGAEGLPQSEDKAFYYAERGARKGLPRAEFAMGMSIAKFELMTRLLL